METETVRNETLEQVKDYYGKVLSSSADLKTGACCTAEALPAHHRKILETIEDEILMKFYGCGSPMPDAMEGRKILDLGCGTGRDVYLAAALAGPEGFVVGIDMTDEQLEVARRHINSQTERFGFKKPNVSFHQGYIEDLSATGIEDESMDLVISNCVINLSPDKERAFQEIFRVLKPGGELYFSDVFADRRIPAAAAADPVMYGECLGGALYIEDFRRMLRDLGVLDYRIVKRSSIDINNEELADVAGNIRFESITIRAFKLPDLEDICEDYGQTATYLGTIPAAAHRFELDDHHLFETGKAMLVCGNTASMLQNTAYGPHFKITGDHSVHFGPFPCGPEDGSADPSGDSCVACC